MKLKILPPTIRGPKRYIAFEVISQKSINRDDLVSIIWDSCLKLHGECETSRFRLWLMRLWTCPSVDQGNNYKNNDFYMKGILQCNRKDEEKVRAAMCLTHQYKGKRVVFYTLGLSGTIRSATQKFIKPRN
ncbi:Rpp14/Pop5 family protein [Methanobacterium alcaliphilum]|uniref:Rpp14/Pop5 family protein n=1 Tax=Methanobacterium alcaliphilum TaxID=392018 RepID=UPI00200A2B63|nr:Rpp14/Pop5 family protein [Methanobacterium alcaliphilum]MCK9152066.1 ribonuclease P [Methanobacterium alcaliphilum]